MVLALCTSSDDILSMYQVLFNSLLYFQRYAPDKLNTAEIRKGSNSVYTGDMVMVLAFCDSTYSPLSVYQVSFNSLVSFQRYALVKFFIAKSTRTPLSGAIYARGGLYYERKYHTIRV